jgi:F420-dependent oxidoreductase-like protein
MRFSLNINRFSWKQDPGRELGRVVRAADEGGLDTVWVGDHLLQADPTSTPESEIFEAYTTLGFLAASSERVRLGTMVTGAIFRAPALLIKAVTTVDVLSGGRAWLGIGSGYNEFETKAMGLAMPSTAERFERLEEILQLAKKMWAGDDSPFEGKHFKLGQPLCRPLPVSKPHPPILIGGMGERKTLRLVARYGDACNLFDIPDGGQTVRHKLEVLRGHCEAEGRSYDEIQKSVSTWLKPDEPAGEFIERCRALAELGIDHIVTIRPEPWTEAGVETLAVAARELRQL